MNNHNLKALRDMIRASIVEAEGLEKARLSKTVRHKAFSGACAFEKDQYDLLKRICSDYNVSIAGIVRALVNTYLIPMSEREIQNLVTPEVNPRKGNSRSIISLKKQLEALEFRLKGME